jgi:hypothetical protein
MRQAISFLGKLSPTLPKLTWPFMQMTGKLLAGLESALSPRSLASWFPLGPHPFSFVALVTEMWEPVPC